MRLFIFSCLFFVALCAYGQVPQVVAGELEVTAGSTTSVPVQVSQFTDVVSIQFTLQWDPNIIEYQGTSAYGLPGLSEFNFGEPEVDQGRLTFVWFDGQVNGISLADDSVIFAVDFQVIGEPGESSPLAFISAPTPIQIGVIDGVEIEEVDGDFTEGEVRIISETDPLDVNVGITDNQCAEDAAGILAAMVSGGVPPYGYSWIGPNGFSSDEASIENLLAGDYELTVTDQQGESFTAIYTVNAPSPLVFLSVAIEDSDCTTPTGSIQLSAGGGTPAYQYDFGDGLSDTDNAQLLAGGEYTVRIQDAQGCLIDTLLVVPQVDAPSVMLGDDQTLCPGEMTQLTANTSDNVSFSWFQDGQMLMSTEASIMVSSPGEYSILVTNTAGCTAEDLAVISVAEVPIIELGPDTSICPKTTLFLLADGSFATYNWSVDGQTTGSDNPELPVSVAGVYTLLATTAEGCSQNDTIQIDLLPFPTSVGPDTIIVAGEPLQLLATGGVAYQWNGPADLSCFTCPNPEVILEQTTTFLVDITSADGCEVTETLTVTVEEAPELDVNIVNFLSPNGDGKNDVLIFRGLENYPANQLSIFNRWGDLLFSKPNYQLEGEPWDGTFNGQLLPPGIYYYVLQVGLTAQPIKSALTIVHP